MPIQLLSRSRLNSLMAEMMPDHDIAFAIDNGDGTFSPVVSHVRGSQARTMTAPDEKYPTEALAVGAAYAWTVEPREDYPGRLATRDDLRRW